ncbi:MAG: hypothetical protein QG673_110 [Pseudomonadota bacterium]|nr:hypothetical protein [Pseudomonadota bacterium]
MISWMSIDNKLWIFGGNGYDNKGQKGYLNDLWQYDIKTKLWTWTGGSKTIGQAGIYGTKGQAGSSNTPGGREGAVSWTGTDGKLWLFGGYGIVSNSSGVPVQGFLNDLWQYDPSSKLWTWISGSNTLNAHANYGVKGIAASTNVPGSRSGAINWVDKSGNLWLFGGNGFVDNSNHGLLNDLWKYDITLKQWIWVGGTNLVNQSGFYGAKGIGSTTNMPGSRIGAVSVVESSGQVLLLGGSGFATNGSAGSLNDVWQYDADNNRWTWVSGSTSVNQAGVDDTHGSFSSTNLPGGRSKAVGWIDQKNSHLWLFGGYGYDTNGDIGVMGDLWQYIPSTDIIDDSGTWTWVNGTNDIDQYWIYDITAPANNMPGGEDLVAGIADNNNTLWMYGGYGYGAAGRGFIGDLWKYDIPSNIWTLVFGDGGVDKTPVYGSKGSPSASNNPGGREAAIMWADNSGSLWLFGGIYGSTVHAKNDLWKYDPSSGYWTWVGGSSSSNQTGTYGSKGVPSASNIPGGRYGMSRWTDKNGKFWLFGGYGNTSSGSGTYNDLWSYDCTTNQWTWMSGASTFNQAGTYGTKGVPGSNNVPGARSPAAVWVDESNNLWLFGGTDQNYKHRYSDLWRYNIRTKQWTWMSGANTANTQYGVYGTLGVPDAKNIPGMRGGAHAWIDNSNNLWLFGGQDCDSGCPFLNDLWKYNIPTGLWTWMGGSNTYDQVGVYGVKGVSDINNVPGSRFYGFAWTDNSGAFWLFGGLGYVYYATYGMLNDLWKYVPPAN